MRCGSEFRSNSRRSRNSRKSWLCFGIGVEAGNFRRERVRITQQRQHVPESNLVVVCVEDVGWKVPQLLEPTVEADDTTVVVDDMDAVCRRFECCCKH